MFTCELSDLNNRFIHRTREDPACNGKLLVQSITTDSENEVLEYKVVCDRCRKAGTVLND